MSVYHKENPKFLDRAMKSIWSEQTLKPSDIVLVKDGKLTDELNAVIDSWKDTLGDVLNVVALEQNVGLGDALAIGIKQCKFELVARMDSDDISLKDRFKTQVKVFKKYSDIDVCSGWIEEFNNDENNICGYRKLPQTHREIYKFAKHRSPINHPCVMFKKSAVLSSGNYEKMLFFEDYYLWVKMLLNGYKFYNIQGVLLKFRSGHNQLLRRCGFGYAVYEFKFHLAIYRLGFLSFFQFGLSAVFKFIARLLPIQILKIIYKILRK